jgi:hypothetical protein
VLAAAIVGKVGGADGFETYPAIEIEVGAGTLALCGLIVASGLVPWRRRPRRAASPARTAGPGAAAALRGPGAAPLAEASDGL